MLKAIICLLIPLILTSCSINISDTSTPPIPAIATENIENNGNKTTNYVNDIIFLGESTTYHLKSRGVLSGGKETKQVWAPKSGTLMLDTSINDCRIIYPELNQELSLSEALQKKKPKMMLLTFGLNGETNFISRGDSYFKYCYQKLIDEIKNNSPNTEIIINSCFPIAKNMDMSRYSVDAKTLNSYIDIINNWALEIAEKNGLHFTNSASVIKDPEGFLATKFQVEDGYHLNGEAYKLILKYLNNDLQKYKEN